ncbi:FtsK/SpoIIIE domain-containing protein [Microbacterium lacticum]|uniref:FtsK/SpoIIIE domain-containing protein n=1 Tax=Microbacterium lacticum TaxID=33885 RepID=UPI003A838953
MSRPGTFGVDENGRDVVWDHFAAMHSVIQGATRSGKSVLAYAVLADAARDPRIRVVGVDPSGLLLAPHRRGDDDALIHLGTADPEAACQVVEQLVRMMDKRIRILLERGLDSVPKCVHRRAFPLFLIVFEELPAILSWLDGEDQGRKPGEKFAPRMRLAMGRLLRESAKAGMRVSPVLIQRAEVANLPGRAQYARRVSMRVDNRASVELLMELATPEDVDRIMGLRPGQGVIHEAGEPLRYFRADYLEYADYRAAVLAARAGDPSREVVSDGAA